MYVRALVKRTMPKRPLFVSIRRCVVPVLCFSMYRRDRKTPPTPEPGIKPNEKELPMSEKMNEPDNKGAVLSAQFHVAKKRGEPVGSESAQTATAEMSDFTGRLAHIVKMFTAPHLAEAVGCHLRTIYKWRDGDTEPRRDELVKIAEYADCTLDWLCTGRGRGPRRRLAGEKRVGDLPGESVDIPSALGDGGCLTVDADWLPPGLLVDDLGSARMRGNQMLPTLADGDVMVVAKEEGLGPDGLYVVDLGGGVSVRRITRMGGAVHLTCDNPQYRDQVVEIEGGRLPDWLLVIGRIVWYGHRA